jgi:hypothetical protein
MLALSSFTSIEAQQLKGFSFESRRMVRININGQDVNKPSQSCFVANINRGRYLVKAYISNRCIYQENIYYQGYGIKKITILSNNDPDHDYDNDYDDDDFDNDDYCDDNHHSSDKRAFKQLLNSLKEAPFDDEKLDFIKAANFKNILSVKEVNLLIKQFSFGGNKLKAAKLLYRSCYEKQLYYTVAESLTFLSEKEELLEYIKSVR